MDLDDTAAPLGVPVEEVDRVHRLAAATGRRGGGRRRPLRQPDKLAKPRGYPGDDQILTFIFDDAPRSAGIGGYIDAIGLTRSYPLRCARGSRACASSLTVR